ncbi:phosphoribosyltransferase family protein [Helicobacter cappadocius]|uniref:Phosphoribosyltransferase family protein n=1 Tax=Helicobacter cappadocius TaxID=3063998 RepID=A0ABT8Z5P9_9HELI|nr:phosphoribosyltransferase family protein [Helicobacter sp. faydin-H75]MDO7253649.1 phosphoribosyltransferase family protein [Helicobacter sp. faydin-H75]
MIDGISIYSFYRYEDISMLIGSKYSIFGSRVLKILSKKASEYFFNSHNISLWEQAKIYGIAIDDCVRSHYSHTAVILREFCKHSFRPSYGALKAKNMVHYAGKSLLYRQSNPRNFIYTKKFDNVFIVDDIITTGTTIKEAKKTVEKNGSNVLFAIVLCDAKS